MKNSIFALSVTALFSVSTLASDYYIVSDPKELLPGEDVKNFSTVDLNGDGVDELVFVTASGQLKYSQLIGLGRGFIDESSFESLKGKEFLTNVSLIGQSGGTRLGIEQDGDIYVLKGRYKRCLSGLRIRGNKLSGNPGNRTYFELTYVSNDFIAGKMKCIDYSIEQPEEIQFTATLAN
ncbi:hypothetical protein F0224_03980 [Vibrio coralliilyticus]|uniref:hypothetical protein n=1 Tax=Vibrio coralliilyticus TaxID=190893 RepID=UPI000390AE18|nr:hypothetical protein [Vibrio coralliilyticus]ERB66291.1 hypothetical protein N779_05305 [Vibrio coralliilyticus OCN008]NOI74827.1 hypothetical protein [Vibrio coralliilyticus]PAW05412.1 hypothetical protein CKJ79_03985 [Vibrio coralliilyticus]QIJ87183.1 hypothetical protein G3U99_23425 [Vibrio coralliilyticus OCN008]